jgi:hypothetical protein
MANLTLSVDDKSTERARARAQDMGISLNQFLRDQIDRLAGVDQRARDADAYLESVVSNAGRGHSQGWKYNRDEIQRSVKTANKK